MNSSIIRMTSLFFLVPSACFSADNTLQSTVSLDQATRHILGMDHNTVLGATTENLDGKEVHVIKVLNSDGWIKFYKIDAKTGALIS